MSMIIRKLEMQGFKSFAERTKVVFHPGITAIVGPNGTGKSNLLDALLWATGGLRFKGLRGDRTEDVIFNGNAKRPALNMADVVITLGSEEEELVVSHRVFRNGEGEYRLNGKVVRLKDVQDELWKHRIGEKEYFVIEQGAIGDFVTSKPTEKRALIEEAAGTAYYKDKRRQAQNKLESTEQNLIRLEDIIAEVEKQKNSLQRQTQAANRYRRLRERIRELSSHHYRRKLAELEKLGREAAGLYEQALAAEKEAAAGLKTAEQETAGLRNDLWRLEKDIQETQEKLFSLRSQTDRTEGEAERGARRVDELEERKKRAGRDRDELNLELVRLMQEAVAREEGAAALEREGSALSEAAELAAATLAAAREERLRLEAGLEAGRHAYLETLQALTEAKNERARSEKELEMMARQAEKLERDLEEAGRQLSEKEEQLAALEKSAAEQEESRRAAEEAVKRAEASLGALAAEVEKLGAELAGLKDRRNETAFHLQALRRVEEKERQSSSGTEVGGSLGLLADLVRAASEDAPLFDLFWGDAAKARVVPAADFLREAEGRVKGRFLLLPEKERAKFPAELLARPGVCGLLKARLEARDRLKERLGGLEDAVVVGTWKEAVALWLEYPEVNFVTLGGDLLLASGLFKAGEKGAGLISLTAELAALEAELARVESLIAPLEREFEEKSRLRDEARLELEMAGQEAARAEKAGQEKLRELKFARQEAERARTSGEILARELELLRGEMSGLTGRQAESKARLEELEARAQAARSALEAGEKEAAGAAEKVAALERAFLEQKAGLNLVRERASAVQAALDDIGKRQAALKSRIDHLEKEIADWNANQAELRLSVEAGMKKAAALKDECGRTEALLAESEGRLGRLKQDLEEKEAALGRLREKAREVQEERVRHEIRKAQLERDLVNLEEMSWQELKKTLVELKQEAEAEAAGAGAAGEAEAAAAEELLEEKETEGEESEAEGTEGAEAAAAEGAEAASEAGAGPEAKPRRPARKWRPVREMSDEEVERELEEAREAFNRIKQVNLMADEEYLEHKKRYEFLVGQREDLRASIVSTQEAIRKIDQESETQFLKALEEVNRNFNEVFTSLFKGGQAEVKLLEPENPLESGVEIAAQPPGKRLQNLSLLSGGEKSLTSLAFLFALFRYRPSPFCFLDEVDAALDDVNLARFLELMKKVKQQTQFIIITHNYKTMEVADYIYGTTMPEPNVTRLLSVKLERKEDASGGDGADAETAVKESA
jgi:chromosome segregation protein